MKATMSKDGRRRITVRVTHRLGRDEVTNLLARYALSYDLDGYVPQGNVTRHRAEKMIRTAMLDKPDPMDWWEWDTELDEDLAEIIRSWATMIVDTLFAELG